ncbi:HNH endonuclease [Microbacterium phage Jovita]|uniref:HNH endonuclease n=1 Tax=Microbacterium phage Jovita TaxID=2985323 RepID=UPI00243264B9|nr:HNH endonuclease [Microbacterium phage Jovita]UYL86355.1 HNH endonuclease [Microbacterium phage Jovita]
MAHPGRPGHRHGLPLTVEANVTRSHSKSLARSAELTKLAERRWGPKLWWHCVYCGRGAGMVVDHFVPEARGGTDEPHNLMPACDRCNSSKQDHAPEAWMAAVGVPEPRQTLLFAVWNLPSWTAPRNLHITRLELDYAPARHIGRPNEPREGK